MCCGTVEVTLRSSKSIDPVKITSFSAGADYDQLSHRLPYATWQDLPCDTFGTPQKSFIALFSRRANFFSEIKAK